MIWFVWLEAINYGGKTLVQGRLSAVTIGGRGGGKFDFGLDLNSKLGGSYTQIRPATSRQTGHNYPTIFRITVIHPYVYKAEHKLVIQELCITWLLHMDAYGMGSSLYLVEIFLAATSQVLFSGNISSSYQPSSLCFYKNKSTFTNEHWWHVLNENCTLYRPLWALMAYIKLNKKLTLYPTLRAPIAHCKGKEHFISPIVRACGLAFCLKGLKCYKIVSIRKYLLEHTLGFTMSSMNPNNHLLMLCCIMLFRSSIIPLFFSFWCTLHALAWNLL